MQTFQRLENHILIFGGNPRPVISDGYFPELPCLLGRDAYNHRAVRLPVFQSIAHQILHHLLHLQPVTPHHRQRAIGNLRPQVFNGRLKNGQHRVGHNSQGVETELGFSLNDNVAFSTAAPEPAFLGVWGLALIGLALAAKNFRAFIVSTRLLGLWKAGRAKACASILLLLGLISGGAVQASACTYTGSPLTLTFTSSGGSAPIVVQTPAGCPWFAQVAESFLTMRLAISPEKPAGVIVGEGTQGGGDHYA